MQNRICQFQDGILYREDGMQPGRNFKACAGGFAGMASPGMCWLISLLTHLRSESYVQEHVNRFIEMVRTLGVLMNFWSECPGS